MRRAALLSARLARFVPTRACGERYEQPRDWAALPQGCAVSPNSLFTPFEARRLQALHECLAGFWRTDGAVRNTALFALALALALFAGGPARAGVAAGPEKLSRFLTARSEMLALEGGDGELALSARGALLGQLAQGEITVVGLPGEDDPDVRFSGASWQRRINARTVAFGGRELRFRVVGGAWSVRITGVGIDLSSVGGGYLTLRGDGRIGHRQARPLPWPEEWQTFAFGELTRRERAWWQRRLRIEVLLLRRQGLSWREVKRTAAWEQFFDLRRREKSIVRLP